MDKQQLNPANERVRQLLAGDTPASSSRASVLFDKLFVEGSGLGIQTAPNVWTTIKSWANLFDPRSYGKPVPSRTLIHGFSGSLDSGEMLLVIGKPGSGCTTFLKALSNMGDEYKSVTGGLTYGGRAANDGDQDPVRLTFCAEEDSHLPTLTVAQTLRFALTATWDPNASKDTINATVKKLAECVGLGHVLNTKVGNAAIRGVSGGERRRVSLAEAMATCPDVLCLDNPTNGLDSSTALDFIQMMREFTSQHECSTAMSVYQGSNAMVPLFDKVLVINGGRQIYYGRATEAKAYFEGLGFVCPERTTITDFLNSMTAEPELRHVREGWTRPVPLSALQFEEAFRRSRHYKAMLDKEESGRAELASQEPKGLGLNRKVYALPLHRQIYECSIRQFRVLAYDTNTWMVEALTIIVQSLVLGTLYRDQSRTTSAFTLVSGSLFLAVLVPALQSMSEFNNSFAERPLVLRQKRYRFYRPLAYALGLVLTDAAWKIVAIAYNIPQYFLTGYQRSADKFFIWFFIVYILHLALSMIFRAIAVASPNMSRAVLPVGLMFNVFVLYTGLYIPGPQMQVWLFWIKYLNPMYYAYESAMVNEFGDLSYTCSDNDLVPSGTGIDSIMNQVCAVDGGVAGQSIVSGAAYLKAMYDFSVSHLWRNVGINIGIFVFFALCTGFGMERYKLPAGHLATIFYKARPKDLVSMTSSESSDIEKGPGFDGDVPPRQPNLVGELAHGVVPSHDGRTLAWKDITLDIEHDGEQKRLLNGLSGFVEPGKLTALMGASGAGKTTLLNTLAGRLDFGSRSGDIFLDGGPLPKSFRRYMGYVQQQDVHLPSQTVREALQMTARLRRPLTVSDAEKDAHVEAVIRLLEIEDIAEALIGNPGAGLNLEQRKRVSIGVELSAKPDILLLDEPTSGLDGQSALTIGRLLRKMACSGQTVLCTIHQPSTELMELFDCLVLLMPGGRLAYDGPLGDECSTVLEYFARSTRPCGEHENPAEYFVEVVREVANNGSTHPELWNLSPESASRDAQREALIKVGAETALSSSLLAASTYAVPLYTQLMVTMWRTWLYYWRDPDYFVSKLLMNGSNGLLNGLTYLNSKSTQRGAYNRVFSAFMALIVGPPIGLQMMPRFVALREIFTLREMGSLTYSWLCFVIPAIVIELPYALVTSLVYWLLWYFPVGYFTEPTRSGYSFLMYELFSIFCHSLAQLCAALMPSLNAAFTANGFFFMFVNIFSGTLSPEPITPTGWRWYYKVSPLWYHSEGVMSNALEGLELRCDPAEVSVFQPPAGSTCVGYAAEFLRSATGYLLNPNATVDCQYCRYTDGQSYYAQWGYDFVNRYKNVGIVIGFIAFNYTAVIALTYALRIKKWKRD
ncbi:ABC transporter PeaB1 [Xylaria arbuscula]|nr:ABC transporter PeaB1 [Xylaria arbuscula]